MGKRLMTCLLVAAMVLLLLPMQVFADESYQVMTVDKTSVNVGDTVHVKVVIPEGIENAGSFTVALNFDPAKFEVVSRNENSEITATDAEGNKVTVAVAANDVAAANNSGSLRTGAIYSENTMQVAGFTAIEATLKAIAAGNADFAFEVFEVTKSVDGATQWIVEDADVAAPPVVIAPVNYTVELDPSTLKESTEEQTVVMTVKTSMPVSVDGVDMTIMIPEGWSLAAIENETLGFGSGNVNLANGMVSYYTSDAENWETELIAKVTYTVPANAAAGTYQLGIKDLVLSADSGTVWEKGGAVSATLTVKQVSADAGKITVGAVKGRAGETVDVVVSMEKNPGIVTLLLKLGYDTDVMTLTAVNDAGILGKAMHTDNLNMNPYQLTWDNGTSTTNFTSVGDLATLSFTISEDAEEGTYPITLDYSYDDTMNVDLDNVEFATEGNILTVSNVVVGDVNGDGAVNMKDSVLLSRYVAKWSGYDSTKVDLAAADVNGDGYVNMKDSVILSRYIAKWTGYTELPHN